MKRTTVLALILLIGTSASIPAQLIVNPANGHSYMTTSGILNLPGARAEAAAVGGHLVVINDAAENAWVVANFQNAGSSVWIGLSDELTEGTFLWDNGEPFSYSNWGLNEPNNFGGNEDHVEMVISGGQPGVWNDLTYTINRRGIIEIPRNWLPGSGEDFILASGLNAAPSQADVGLFAAAGDSLALLLASPLGAYDGTTPILYCQLYESGITPFPPFGYPEVHLDFATGAYFKVMVIHTGVGAAPPLDLLPPGGMSFSDVVPPGLGGLHLMIQGFSLAPSTNMGNPWFTATDARAIHFI